MLNNPFASSTYEKIWLNHFYGRSNSISFKFINGVSFIKGNTPSQYLNIGKNYTNGMLYQINPEEVDFKGKSFVVHDVPNYLIGDQKAHSNLKVKKVQQYKGLYVDISKFQKFEDVLTSKFKSSRSRYNFRQSIKKLNQQCDLSQKMFYGSIEKGEYDVLIEHFKYLLEIRFNSIKIHNTVLPMWDFYKDVLFPLINEKRVALFVMYDGVKPIAMSFSFVYDKVFVVALRTFDVSYPPRLAIGNIEIYKLIEWCFNNQVKILDFSKGESEYKERWCDSQYHYEHHIMYDAKSIPAKIVSNITAFKLILKQNLRDKNINVLFTKLVYKSKFIFTNKK